MLQFLLKDLKRRLGFLHTSRFRKTVAVATFCRLCVSTEGQSRSSRHQKQTPLQGSPLFSMIYGDFCRIFGKYKVASLKDTIAKKDEEIERLQLLKDLKTQSPTVNGEKRATKLLSHASSSPSLPSSPAGPTRRSRSLSSGRGTRPIDKPASDQDNFSEHSDKHSESSSQHSLDDFRHEKEILGQSKLTGTETGPFPVDIEALGFSNVDSDERLSDTSDGHISTGAEPDGSAELTLSTEGVKPAETTEKMTKVSSQVPRPTQKSTQTTSTRVATKVPSKGPTGLRKAAATSATTSSTKASSRRFQ